MAEVKWIKLHTDMFDNSKIRYIRTLPEGNNMVLIWVMLLSKAGKCNASGFIFLTENIPYTSQMLAAEFGFDIYLIELALATFVKLNMIQLEEHIIKIAGWEEHQNIDGLDRIREQTRKRVAKYRENQKQLPCNVTGNDTVTEGNAIEKEREEEREEEKEEDKNNKKKKKSEFDIFIEEYTENLKLKETIYEFIKMRKAIKAPMTSNALKLMLRKLDNISNNDDEKIEIINNSILNSWKGIFPLKSTDSEYGGNSRNDKGRSKSDGNSGVTSNNNREKSDEWVGL